MARRLFVGGALALSLVVCGVALATFAEGSVSYPPAGRESIDYTWCWSGYAEVVKRDGRVIPVHDSGTVQAPDRDTAARLSDFKFRFGAVERARDLGDDVRNYRVVCSGPL